MKSHPRNEEKEVSFPLNVNIHWVQRVYKSIFISLGKFFSDAACTQPLFTSSKSIQMCKSVGPRRDSCKQGAGAGCCGQWQPEASGYITLSNKWEGDTMRTEESLCCWVLCDRTVSVRKTKPRRYIYMHAYVDTCECMCIIYNIYHVIYLMLCITYIIPFRLSYISLC